MKRWSFILWALVLCSAHSLARNQVAASDSSQHIDIMAVNKVARKLIAPCCWSETADAHRSEAAVQMRAQIREALQGGFTEAQIIESYVKEYGERVLSTPKAEGFNYMAWIMPGVALVLGLFAAWRFIHHAHTQSRPLLHSPQALVEDEYTKRIEEELKAYDR